MFDWFPDLTDFLDRVHIWREGWRMMGIRIFPNAVEARQMHAFRKLISEMEWAAQTFSPNSAVPVFYGSIVVRLIDLRSELRALDVVLPQKPSYADMSLLIALARARRLDEAQKIYHLDT